MAKKIKNVILVYHEDPVTDQEMTRILVGNGINYARYKAIRNRADFEPVADGLIKGRARETDNCCVIESRDNSHNDVVQAASDRGYRVLVLWDSKGKHAVNTETANFIRDKRKGGADVRRLDMWLPQEVFERGVLTFLKGDTKTGIESIRGYGVEGGASGGVRG